MHADGKDYGSFSYGIPIADEDSIMGHLDSLGGRIRQLLDIIAALRQFSMLGNIGREDLQQMNFI